MLITQGAFSHIGQLDGAFRASIHKPVATLWMEFCSSNNFSELFHINRLDVNDIEALVLNVKIPKVYSEVVTTDKCLSIAIDRYAVDVICVGIRVCSTWDGGNHSVMMCQTRKFQSRSIFEANV